MESNQQFEEDLSLFGLPSSKENKDNIKEVEKRYHKLAKQNHPDRPGGSDKAFQDIQNVYIRIINYMNKKYDDSTDSDSEKNFFTQNNFPKQKKSSTVVILENDKSNQWQSVPSDVFGEGSPISSGINGRIFRSGNLTITFYDKPKKDKKTKIHVQGQDVDAQLDFVFSEMPKLYNKVCEMVQTISIKSRDCDNCEFNSNKASVLVDHIQKNHILSDQEKAKLYIRSNINQSFACEICDYKADKMIKVKLHMRKHFKQPVKRKTTRKEIHISIEKVQAASIYFIENPNSEALLQEDETSTNIIDDLDTSNTDLGMKQNIVNDVMEEAVTENLITSTKTETYHEINPTTNSPRENIVEIDTLISCNECEFDCDADEILK